MGDTGQTPAIYGALAKVMAEVGVVGKAKKNAQQGYQFRGIDDVVAHVQQVMAAQGVVVVPRVLEREREMIATKNGGTMASVRLLVAHDFCALDGSKVTCVTLGEAMDSGDKASNKAMSAALKYALTETLLIPTYEADRDTEEASPQIGDRAEALKAQLATSRPAAVPPPAAPRPVASRGVVLSFPNYGRNKGGAIAGASAKDLDFYEAGAVKNLGDPSKSRFHASEQALFEAIRAERARQQDPQKMVGEVPNDADEPPPHGDEDAPF